jgi:hypothetical protein
MKRGNIPVCSLIFIFPSLITDGVIAPFRCHSGVLGESGPVAGCLHRAHAPLFLSVTVDVLSCPVVVALQPTAADTFLHEES